MEGSYLPPCKCILYGKQDWEVEETLDVHPLPLPPLKETLYVLADVQVQFELAQHTMVLYSPNPMGERVWSIMNHSIHLSMASILSFILASGVLEVRSWVRYSFFILSYSSLPFSLATIGFISTSMASFIMSAREIGLLSLSHRVNSFSKASVY